MKLSVISINFNNCDGLSETIPSVIKQQGVLMEYIIIDGGSNDGSKRLIEKYSSNISYWVSEPDNGIYHAMNKGIKKATGDYLLFLNSGDYLLDENVCKRMMQSATADIVYGNLERHFPDGKTDIVKMPNNLSVAFLADKVLCHPVTFIKRVLFDRYGYYNEQLKIVSDWEFFFKAIVCGNASWQYRDVNVCMFDMNGMSSKQDNMATLISERDYVKKQYYSKPVRNLVMENEKQLWELKTLKDRLYNKKEAFKTLIPQDLLCFIRKLNWIKNRIIFRQLINPKSIPIIINSFNRLKCLRQQVADFERLGYKNLVILDNASSYLPLKQYLSETPYRVIQLPDNLGHLAFWKSGLFKEFNEQFFFLTDPDILLGSDYPADFGSQFLNIMARHPQVWKIGCALSIHDLPEHNTNRFKVISWEQQFWEKEIDKGVYEADVDTTLALYRPSWFAKKYEGKFFEAYRVAGSYTAKHEPWYLNSSEAKTEEEIHYEKSAGVSASWIKQLHTHY